MCNPALRIDQLGQSTIAVVGEVDAHTVDALTAATVDLGVDYRIDLSQCSFMDSSGIAWLVDAKQSADSHNGSIILLAPSEPVSRLLRVCGLDDLFRVEPTSSVDVSDPS